MGGGGGEKVNGLAWQLKCWKVGGVGLGGRVENELTDVAINVERYVAGVGGWGGGGG